MAGLFQAGAGQYWVIELALEFYCRQRDNNMAGGTSGMKRFSEEHEWVEVKGGIATMGITTYAAEELGDITFVELPTVGTVVAQGESLCVIESVKAASDVFSPIGGTVKEVNMALEDDPGLINASAEKEGWICKLEDIDTGELDSLMTESEYEAFTEGDGEE